MPRLEYTPELKTRRDRFVAAFKFFKAAESAVTGDPAIPNALPSRPGERTKTVSDAALSQAAPVTAVGGAATAPASAIDVDARSPAIEAGAPAQAVEQLRAMEAKMGSTLAAVAALRETAANLLSGANPSEAAPAAAGAAAAIGVDARSPAIEAGAPAQAVEQLRAMEAKASSGLAAVAALRETAANLLSGAGPSEAAPAAAGGAPGAAAAPAPAIDVDARSRAIEAGAPAQAVEQLRAMEAKVSSALAAVAALRDTAANLLSGAGPSEAAPAAAGGTPGAAAGPAPAFDADARSRAIEVGAPAQAVEQLRAMEAKVGSALAAVAALRDTAANLLSGAGPSEAAPAAAGGAAAAPAIDADARSRAIEVGAPAQAVEQLRAMQAKVGSTLAAVAALRETAANLLSGASPS